MPAGQHVTTGFPVLDLGIQPEMDLNTWKLQIFGHVEKPLELTFEQLKALGEEVFVKDMHCVTSWSKFDVPWKGVHMDKIIKIANPKAGWKHIIQYGADKYTTNVPKEDLYDAFIAYEYDKKPLSREHGYVRVMTPHLFAWKGSKFLIAIEFSVEDKPGFWEVRGYHNRGDAFKEERYS